MLEGGLCDCMIELQKPKKDKVANCCIHIVRVEEEFPICANVNEMSITSVCGDHVERDRGIYLICVYCDDLNVT